MSNPRISNRRRMIIMGLALLGACFGYAFGQWATTAAEGASPEVWSDVGALFLSLALVAQGVIAFMLSLSRNASGEMLTGEEGRRATPEQVAFQRLQAGVLILAGAMLSAPVLAPLAQSIGWTVPAPAVTLSTIVICFAIQTVMNLMIWRRSDEFVRRLIAETSSACFWILQAALFLWAAGERLGLLPAISTWECTVVLMGVYLAASGYISLRNGATT